MFSVMKGGRCFPRLSHSSFENLPARGIVRNSTGQGSARRALLSFQGAPVCWLRGAWEGWGGSSCSVVSHVSPPGSALIGGSSCLSGLRHVLFHSASLSRCVAGEAVLGAVAGEEAGAEWWKGESRSQCRVPAGEAEGTSPES